MDISLRRPEDWTLSWGGSGTIYGWGHNHRGQLGGVEGAKVKTPTACEALSTLRPIQLLGGEQTLFAVTADGKVYATGELIPEGGSYRYLIAFFKVMGQVEGWELAVPIQSLCRRYWNPYSMFS